MGLGFICELFVTNFDEMLPFLLKFERMGMGLGFICYLFVTNFDKMLPFLLKFERMGMGLGFICDLEACSKFQTTFKLL
jgi:hypothetical protein